MHNIFMKRSPIFIHLSIQNVNYDIIYLDFPYNIEFGPVCFYFDCRGQI